MKERGLCERLFLCALGAVAAVEERVGGILEDLEKKGEDKERELGEKLRSVGTGRPFEVVEKTVKGIMKRLDIPTASDIRRLREDIKRVEELLSNAEKGGEGKADNC